MTGLMRRPDEHRLPKRHVDRRKDAADTIVGDRAITVARELARPKRDLGWSYDETADLLNRACFITRSGTDRWHAASVRELLL